MAPKEEQQSLLATDTDESSGVSCDRLSAEVGYGSNTSDKPFILTIDDAIERLGYGRFQHYLLWAAGLCMMADGLEVLLLSFLTLVLRTSSDWNLTNNETNSIVASVFLGATVGSLVLGGLADRYGRKPIFTLTAAMIAIFGLATGFAPSYSILLICRFGVGFGVGGLTVPFDTLTEFLPKSQRGTNLLAVEFFWTTGTMLVVLLAYFTLGQGTTDTEEGVVDHGAFRQFWHGWRIFVILCAVPCIFSTLWGIYCVPESPRWLLETKQDPEQALRILREAAVVNGKNPMELYPPNTQLQSGDSEESGEAGLMELFSPKWLWTTLFLWGTWLGFAFLYYGGVIATTLVFAESHSAIQAESENRQATYHFDYVALFVSNSAEIVGTAVVVMTVDMAGRIPIQFVSYSLGGVLVLTLCILASSENHDHYYYIMVCLSFGVRMLMMAASCTTWVSTAEILTTDIRSTGHSAANAMARIGGFIVPYVVSPTTKLTTIGYSMLTVALCTAYCAWNLPETKGLDLGAATLKKEHKNIRESGSSNKV